MAAVASRSWAPYSRDGSFSGRHAGLCISFNTRGVLPWGSLPRQASGPGSGAARLGPACVPAQQSHSLVGKSASRGREQCASRSQSRRSPDTPS